MNFNNAIDKFKTYLVLEKSLSGSTIEAYLTDIAQLGVFCKEKLGIDDPGEINEKKILEYFQSKSKGESLNPRTMAREISSIRSFYKYLRLDGLVKSELSLQIKPPKQSRKIPVILLPDEINAMLGAIEMYKPEGQRNKALIMLMLDAGLTVSQAIRLKLSNINFYSGYVVIEGATNKSNRSVPISKETRKEIKQYQKVYRDYLDIAKGSEEILFLNKRGNQLSRVMIFNIIKSLAKKANIQKNVSPYILRHTYAHNLVKEGLDLTEIKARLGHSSIATTEIYTHLSD